MPSRCVVMFIGFVESILHVPDTGTLYSIEVVSFFPVGVIVLDVHKSDIAHPITHKVLSTTQSFVVHKCDNLSNSASQPSSCG